MVFVNAFNGAVYSMMSLSGGLLRGFGKIRECSPALALIVSGACTTGPRPKTISEAPVFERGFHLFPSPRAFDAPGTVFRVDPQGVRHPIIDLSSMVNAPPLDEAIPTITVRGAIEVGAFVGWLSGRRGIAYREQDSAMVAVAGAKRERAFEIGLRKVVDSASRVIDWSKPGKVYLITETVLADSVAIDLGSKLVAAIGDSLKADSARSHGYTVEWNPARSTHLSLRFPHPLRVFYKAEQLLQEHGLEQDSLPAVVRLPAQGALVWRDSL